jgi:hypothetical protein
MAVPMSRREELLYLQREQKRIHDAQKGGGEEPITVRGQLAGALGGVSGAIVGTD